jgi:hypothetical protein
VNEEEADTLLPLTVSKDEEATPYPEIETNKVKEEVDHQDEPEQHEVVEQEEPIVEEAQVENTEDVETKEPADSEEQKLDETPPQFTEGDIVKDEDEKVENEPEQAENKPVLEVAAELVPETREEQQESAPVHEEKPSEEPTESPQEERANDGDADEESKQEIHNDEQNALANTGNSQNAPITETKRATRRMEQPVQEGKIEVQKESVKEVQKESEREAKAQINIVEEVKDESLPAKEIQPVTNNKAQANEEANNDLEKILKKDDNYKEVEIKKKNDTTKKDSKDTKKLSKIEGVNDTSRQAQLPESRQC